MSNVKFWYSARNFDSCSKGEFKFKDGSVLRVNINPRIKLSFPKNVTETSIPRNVFEKMDDIISNNIYKYTKDSSSKDQFEHGVQALFNIIETAENIEQSFDMVMNFTIIPNPPQKLKLR